MDSELQNVKDNFLYPVSSYHGSLTDEAVIFHAKLQEFAQKVGFIANLYSGGKLPLQETYFKVESLWRDLESIKAIDESGSEILGDD